MVVTMLEARIEKEAADLLAGQFGAAGGSLPTPILESFLLHNADNDMWRIVTVWESQDALDGYRASVETPEGVRMFRAAGAEPALTIFNVEAHLDHS